MLNRTKTRRRENNQININNMLRNHQKIHCDDFKQIKWIRTTQKFGLYPTKAVDEGELKSLICIAFP